MLHGSVSSPKFDTMWAHAVPKNQRSVWNWKRRWHPLPGKWKVPGISHWSADMEIAVEGNCTQVEYGGRRTGDIEAYPELAIGASKWPIAEEIVGCGEYHHLQG